MVTQENSTAITNSHLATADTTGNAGIRYSVASSNLTVESGIELHVKAGKTYSPGGTVATQGVDTGDFHVDTGATANLANSTNSISGDVDVDGTLNLGASVNFGGSTFVSAGTTASTAGTHTFTT